MGKSAGTAKPTTPLAEQRIDLASMQLGTIVKIANAKDKVKSAAAKAARVRLRFVLVVVFIGANAIIYSIATSRCCSTALTGAVCAMHA